MFGTNYSYGLVMACLQPLNLMVNQLILIPTIEKNGDILMIVGMSNLIS